MPSRRPSRSSPSDPSRSPLLARSSSGSARPPIILAVYGHDVQAAAPWVGAGQGSRAWRGVAAVGWMITWPPARREGKGSAQALLVHRVHRSHPADRADHACLWLVNGGAFPRPAYGVPPRHARRSTLRWDGLDSSSPSCSPA